MSGGDGMPQFLDWFFSQVFDFEMEKMIEIVSFCLVGIGEDDLLLVVKSSEESFYLFGGSFGIVLWV